MFEYVLCYQHQLITHQFKEWLCLNNEAQLGSRTVNSKFGHEDQIQFQGYMSHYARVGLGSSGLLWPRVVKSGSRLIKSGYVWSTVVKGGQNC